MMSVLWLGFHRRCICFCEVGSWQGMGSSPDMQYAGKAGLSIQRAGRNRQWAIGNAVNSMCGINTVRKWNIAHNT